MDLSSSLGFTPHQPCDLGQITQPLLNLFPARAGVGGERHFLGVLLPKLSL